MPRLLPPSSHVALAVLVAAAMLAACDTPAPGGPDVLLAAAFEADRPTRLHTDLAWTPAGLYTSGLPAIARYRIDAGLSVVSFEPTFEWPSGSGRGSLTSLALDGSGRRALAVAGVWADAVAGGLFEIDLDRGTARPLKDSTWNVASAQYLDAGPLGRPGRVLYYAFGYAPQTGGPPAERLAGYYVFDPETGLDSLVAPATTAAGVGAGVHAFDVSPDGRTVVGPAYRADAPVALSVLDLSASPVASRTVAVATRLGDRARSLTVRFSPGGDALAYVANPYGPTPTYVPEPSDLGVIRVGAGTDPSWPAAPRPTAPFPGSGIVAGVAEWSPDGRLLAYTAAPIPADGPAFSPSGLSLFVGPVAP